MIGLVGIDQLFNGPCQSKVFFGHAPSIMGIEINGERIVYIFPVGVVILRLTFKRYSRHGGKGFPKILEFEDLHDRTVLVGPTFQVLQQDSNFFFGQFFHGNKGKKINRPTNDGQ